jgi:iron complex outermembrane receptor protein/vitamin B12 transporter
MSDGFFGNSMLLPNQDLAPGYQKIDVSASYRLHLRLRVYTTIDNLFNQEYAAAFGFPSLPATIRVGASVALGGDAARE